MSEKLPQPMRPTSRIFGWLMEWLAEPNYQWAVKQLKPISPRRYFEIGFGTGRLAELVARTLKPEAISGVDPSELMLNTASARLKRFKKMTVDLRLGDDTKLGEFAGSFDAIVASHSFQFWSDPEATLRRLRTMIATDGRLVFVVRRHISKSVFEWLPNPITKSGDEIGGMLKALGDAGFHVAVNERLRSGSQGLVCVPA
ncbi:MAG: methyltransferase domain-containing protein [Alphaproteobacteria bacterium]|nr:methyltransferase domain-containing protein [Alphaproteobacteria bacterium]